MIVRIKKTAPIAFGSLVALLITLMIFRYSFAVEVPRIFLTIIIIAIACIGNENETLAILLCCIPLHEAIDFYIAILACIMILFVKNSHHVNIRRFIVFGFLMIIWELLHCFSVSISFDSLIVGLVPLTLLIMFLNFDVSEIDYPLIVRSLAFMSAAISVVVFLNTVVQADFNFVNAVLNLRRLGLISEDVTLLGGGINPNSLGVINVLAVTGILQLRFLNRQKKSDYTFCIILITFGVLTSSRTFLVCLLIMFILLIIGQTGRLIKKINFFIGLIAIAVTVLFLAKWLFPSVLEYYIFRFQMENITSGRDVLMTQYHDYIVSHLDVLLFGIGATSLADKAVNTYNIANNGPHNCIQEIILAWGIPGLLMIGLLFFVMVIESKRYGKKKVLLNFIPLIIILVKSMAGQLLTSGYSILALAFAYLSLCQNFNPADSSEQTRL